MIEERPNPQSVRLVHIVEPGLAFPAARDPTTLTALLAAPTPAAEPEVVASIKTKEPPREGPLLTPAQAFALRAAAIDACELLVAHAKILPEAQGDGALAWLREDRAVRREQEERSGVRLRGPQRDDGVPSSSEAFFRKCVFSFACLCPRGSVRNSSR